MKALNSTDSSRWNTLESGPRPGPRPSGKGDPQTLRIKFEGANFKYDNSFLMCYPKNTQIRHFWSQI